jgi:hypothetical protein
MTALARRSSRTYRRYRLSREWAAAFVERLKAELGEELVAVVAFDYQGESYWTSVELLVVTEHLDFELRQRISEIAGAFTFRDDKNVLVNTFAYSKDDLRKSAGGPYYVVRDAIDQGQVLYDSGFFAELRRGESKKGRRDA